MHTSKVTQLAFPEQEISNASRCWRKSHVSDLNDWNHCSWTTWLSMSKLEAFEYPRHLRHAEIMRPEMPVSRCCVWYLFFIRISMSVLYAFRKNEFSQRYPLDVDCVLLYLLETRRVQIVVILRLTTWSTRSKYVHQEVRNRDWRRRFSSLAFFAIPSRVVARLFAILCSQLASNDSYCAYVWLSTVLLSCILSLVSKNGGRQDT